MMKFFPLAILLVLHQHVAFSMQGFQHSDQLALHRAVQIIDSERIQSLVEQGFPLNVQDKNHQTPLHIAAHQSNPFCAQRSHNLQLLVRHASPAVINMQDDIGQTVLQSAIAHHAPIEDIALLLQRNARIDVQNNLGDTALHYAVRRDDGIDVLVRLLYHPDSASAINVKDTQGYTPLRMAIREGETEKAELLLRRKSLVQIDDMFEAISCKNTWSGLDIMRLLLGTNCNNVDINQKVDGGYTLLHYAVIKEHINTVKLLLACSARTDIKNDNHETALDKAKQLDSPAGKEIVRLIAQS